MANNKTLELSIKIAGKMDKSLMAALNGSQSQISSFARSISSIGLAHIGDAVYELLVRTWLCAHGKATGKALHRCAAQPVNLKLGFKTLTSVAKLKLDIFHLMIKYVHAVKEELRQFSRPLRGIGAVHFAFR